MRCLKPISVGMCLLFSAALFAQEKPDPEIPTEVKEQLEDLTEMNEDASPDDDELFQDLEHFLKHPLDLNHADANLLAQLHLLNPLQVSNLILYRKLFGDLVSVYELQAVPGWNIETIRKLLPYITVGSFEKMSSLLKRFKGGENTILLRSTQIFEKSEGYLRDPSSGKSYYTGDKQKVLLRYKYRFKNQLQFGFTAEKDAGEQFFKGAQKSGFDFYSAHLFARNIGIIEAIAIGDFTVNLGQGLIQWQSLTFGKGADVLGIKRQAETIRPYSSVGEIVFNRGAGITLRKEHWRATFFGSYRKIDARLENDNGKMVVISLPVSGLHRTFSEQSVKNALGQSSFGGNINFSTDRFQIGFNTVQYYFQFPIAMKDPLYQKFYFSGRHVSNYSIDYSFTFKNLHFFGESAVDGNLNKAMVNGLALSLNRHIDFSLLHRSISMRYESVYASAFTESTKPVNEQGIFMGLTARPNANITVDAYADLFSFPWLKYRVDAPSAGWEYMIQLKVRQGKESDFYIRYRSKNKAVNSKEANVLNAVENKVKQNLRCHFNLKINRSFSFRSRAEMSWYDSETPEVSKGFLVFADVFYKPMGSKFSGNMRFSYFETDDYDSRLYAYENDVLYSYSIPVFSGKGIRYYINGKYKINRSVSLWLRFAQTTYPDQLSVGSGLDKIEGTKRSELKVQMQWQF